MPDREDPSRTGERGEGGRDVCLRLERRVRAAPAAAFDAFVRPADMSRWFATDVQADLRVGGRYANTDGDAGRFVAIDRPHRIVFTWENPGHCPGTLVAVTFRADGAEHTRVVLEHGGLASPDDREHMSVGWSWALDSYCSYVETGRPVPHET